MAGILFSFDVCLYVLCVCVSAQRTGKSDQFKTVKAMDFKFDMHGQSGREPLKIFPKGGVRKNSLGGDRHSHERLLVQVGVHK